MCIPIIITVNFLQHFCSKNSLRNMQEHGSSLVIKKKNEFVGPPTEPGEIKYLIIYANLLLDKYAYLTLMLT